MAFALMNPEDYGKVIYVAGQTVVVRGFPPDFGTDFYIQVKNGQVVATNWRGDHHVLPQFGAEQP